MVAASIQSVIVARLLGPTGKGLIAVTFLVPSALSLVLTTGFAASTVYFASRVKPSVLARNGYTFGAGAAVVGLAIIAFASWFGLLNLAAPGVSGLFLVAACLALPLIVAHDLQSAMLVGQKLIGRMNAIRLITAGAALIAVTTTAWALDWAAQRVALALVATQLLGAMLENRVLRSAGVTPGRRHCWRQMHEQLRYAAANHVGTVVQFLNYRLDQFMIAGLLGVRALGLYTVAVSLAELLWISADAAATAVFPYVAQDSTLYSKKRTLALAAGVLGISILGALVLAVTGSWIISLVYSSEFRDAYGALVWLLPGACLFGPAKILLTDLAGRGRPGAYSVISVVGLAITVSIMLTLAPTWGIRGAAAASTFAYVTSALLAAIAFWRLEPRSA